MLRLFIVLIVRFPLVALGLFAYFGYVNPILASYSQNDKYENLRAPVLQYLSDRSIPIEKRCQWKNRNRNGYNRAEETYFDHLCSASRRSWNVERERISAKYQTFAKGGNPRLIKGSPTALAYRQEYLEVSKKHDSAWRGERIIWGHPTLMAASRYAEIHDPPTWWNAVNLGQNLIYACNVSIW